jgi:hypothetical protein
MRGQIEPVDVKSGLGEQMRVPPLSARDVEDARSGRKSEQLNETSYFVAVTLEGEDGLVFEQVLSVEVGLPPFSGCGFAWHTDKINGRAPAGYGQPVAMR